MAGMNPKETTMAMSRNRNFNCPHDSQCTGIAAKKHWRGFSCSKCKHKNDIAGHGHVAVLPDNDNMPYYINSRIKPHFDR